MWVNLVILGGLVGLLGALWLADKARDYFARRKADRRLRELLRDDED